MGKFDAILPRTVPLDHYERAIQRAEQAELKLAEAIRERNEARSAVAALFDRIVGNANDFAPCYDLVPEPWHCASVNVGWHATKADVQAAALERARRDHAGRG